MEDALGEARRLLWEAHGRIKEAMYRDDFGPLWDWREGELTDWLLATQELIEVPSAGGVSLEHDGPCVFVDGECACGMLDLGLPSDGPNCPPAILPLAE